MKQVTFIAARNFTIQCESGEVNYKKGKQVHLCHDNKDNVWISYHEQDKDKKVHAFEINILDKDVFASLLENTYLVQEELDKKVSYETITLDKLLIDEQVQMKDLLKLMVESNYTKSPFNSKSNKITVPVLRVKKEMSAKQKAFYISETKIQNHNVKAKKLEAKSIKVISNVNENKGWILNTGALFNKKLSSVSKNVFESLVSFFGDKAKVVLTKENSIKVNLFNSSVSQLKECLTSLKVNFKIEGAGDQKIVKLIKPRASKVVESYYKEAFKWYKFDLDRNSYKAQKELEDEFGFKTDIELNDKKVPSILKVDVDDADLDDLISIIKKYDSKVNKNNIKNYKESYYKKEEEMDGNEIDDVVDPEVINADPFIDAAMKMQGDMEEKASSVNEEDIDQDKADELKSDFDSKMEELNGMEDEESKEKMVKEMEDIYDDYMNVMNGDEPEEIVQEDDEEEEVKSSDCEGCVDGVDADGNDCDCYHYDIDSDEELTFESKKKK